YGLFFFFFSSRRRHTRLQGDWSSDVCSSDLKGAQLCRSAGTYAKLSNKEGDYATLVLPSGETRRVPIDCRATIGQTGNPDSRLRSEERRVGKECRSRGSQDR